ncbi:MAG TPA: hypothetical protein VGK73_27490 [Polyangiaceae bacterium]
MRSVMRLARGAALGIAVLSSVSRARAQAEAVDASVEPRAAPPRVAVASVGQMPGLEALEVRLRSWFGPESTELSVRRLDALDPNEVLSPSGEAGVRVFLVQRSPDTVRLFFTVIEQNQASPRYLVRDVTLDGGLDELGIEQVTQVIYLSSSALWSGVVESPRQEVEQRLAPERAPAPPPKPAARPSERAPRLRGVLGFEYAFRFAGEEGVTHGPAAVLGLGRSHGALALGTRLSAALILPHTSESQAVTLDLRGASFALGAFLSGRVLDRTSAIAEVGLGLDVVRYRVEALADPTLVAGQSEREVRPFLRLRLGLAEEFGPLKVGVAAGACVQFLRTHYDIVEESGNEELFSVWPVQPEIAASILF